MTIYIILPAYNEELSIEKLLSRLQTTMTSLAVGYEVLLVNDGSSDKTLDIARKWQGRMPLHVINHEHNKGIGEAWKSGLMTASNKAQSSDILITMDADNTHPPELIPTLMTYIQNGYDLVIASRYVEGSQEIGLSARRKILSKVAGSLLRIFFPVKNVKDYTCGYRAYRAAIVRQAVAMYGETLIEEKGFTCIVEVLLKLRKLGISAYEAPLVLRYDHKGGESKMPVAKTILRYWTFISRNLWAPGTRPFRSVVPS